MKARRLIQHLLCRSILALTLTQMFKSARSPGSDREGCFIPPPWTQPRVRSSSFHHPVWYSIDLTGPPLTVILLVFEALESLGVWGSCVLTSSCWAHTHKYKLQLNRDLTAPKKTPLCWPPVVRLLPFRYVHSGPAGPCETAAIKHISQHIHHDLRDDEALTTPGVRYLLGRARLTPRAPTLRHVTSRTHTRWPQVSVRIMLSSNLSINPHPCNPQGMCWISNKRHKDTETR